MKFFVERSIDLSVTRASPLAEMNIDRNRLFAKKKKNEARKKPDPAKSLALKYFLVCSLWYLKQNERDFIWPKISSA